MVRPVTCGGEAPVSRGRHRPALPQDASGAVRRVSASALVHLPGAADRAIGRRRVGFHARPGALNQSRPGRLHRCVHLLRRDLSLSGAPLPLNGAQILINLTNDGWYGTSAAPYQHYAMARFRAVENHRFLVRAANTGISAIVDPLGRELLRSELMERRALVGEVRGISEITFYTRYGDVFAWSMVIITALASIAAGARGPGFFGSALSNRLNPSKLPVVEERDAVWSLPKGRLKAGSKKATRTPLKDEISELCLELKARAADVRGYL